MDVAHLHSKCFSSPIPSSSLPVLSRIPISLRRSSRAASVRPIRLCSASGSGTLVAGSRKEDGRVSEAAREKQDESGDLKSWMLENGLPPCKVVLKERSSHHDQHKAIHYIAASEDLQVIEPGRNHCILLIYRRSYPVLCQGLGFFFFCRRVMLLSLFLIHWL